RDAHTRRNTGLAATAVGTVKVGAAAAKTKARQLPVQNRVHRCSRVHEQRCRLSAFQRTARVGGGAEETQFGQIAHVFSVAYPALCGLPASSVRGRSWLVCIASDAIAVDNPASL